MENGFGSIAWVLYLPIIGFLIQAFFGKKVVDSMGIAAGRRVMGTLAVLPIALGFVIGLMLVLKLSAMEPAARSVVVPLFNWIDVMGLRLPFELIVDPLSMTMVLIITGIGALIHLYATGYMAEEPDYPRFFTYLNLFIASMLILVLGNNLALLFIGWEGVGVCSYLLIGFWYKDLANSKAANKAFIVNRIGDWGLTLGLFLIVALLTTSPSLVKADRYLSYDQMLPALQIALAHNHGLATAIALLLFVGACGKSAQFPLYLWLPDAMAGPTPVSALIHAATMVTSGVVLLNRMHIVFEMSPTASAIVAVIGAFTALFAALVAFGQTDIKKVLAYSTVSQLGFMFVACGAGGYWAGMFHVTTHAFFKALLFLGSGAVIHAMAHNQDMRNYGNLSKYLKITCWSMVIGWLAISGVYMFSGFYSKEAIIGTALANTHANIEGYQLGQYSGWTALFVAFLTAMYMTRMMVLTFFSGEERWRLIPAKAHADDHGHGTDIAHGNHLEAVHEHGHDHGPDVHGFFYTDEELHAMEHGDHDDHAHHELDETHQPHEVPPSMWFPLVCLAALSLFGGYFMSHNEVFRDWLYPEGKLPILGVVSAEAEHIPLVLYSSIAAFGGLIIGGLWYMRGLPKAEGWDESKWNPFRKLAGRQFGFDAAMVTTTVDGGAELGRGLWQGFDVKIVDGIVNGSAGLASYLGKGISWFQTGYIRMYALMMLFGGAGILGWFLYAMKHGGVR